MWKQKQQQKRTNNSLRSHNIHIMARNKCDDELTLNYVWRKKIHKVIYVKLHFSLSRTELCSTHENSIQMQDIRSICSLSTHIIDSLHLWAATKISELSFLPLPPPLRKRDYYHTHTWTLHKFLWHCHYQTHTHTHKWKQFYIFSISVWFYQLLSSFKI